MLKAVAMEAYNCYTLEELAVRLQLPESDVFTHALEQLAVHLHSLYGRLRAASQVWRAFARVNQWRPSWRYQPGDSTPSAAEAAKTFLQDVQVVYNWLEQNRG